jgi:phosphoribosylanthranilate isomerase
VLDPMYIKASGIQNLTDARYFAAKEVDVLGFCLEEGAANYIDPIQMRAICEWVEGPLIIGEFPRVSASVVRETARFFGLSGIQMPLDHWLEDPADWEGISLFLEIDRKISGLDAIWKTHGEAIAYFVMHTGMETQPETALSDGFFERFPVLIQSDLSATTFLQLLTRLKPAGFCLAGGEEEKTGIKSFDEIEAVFDGMVD